MPEPVVCEMARPGDKEHGLSNDRDQWMHVTDHVWLVYDRIELLEDGDCYDAEREVRRRHSVVKAELGDQDEEADARIRGGRSATMWNAGGLSEARSAWVGRNFKDFLTSTIRDHISFIG